MADSFCRNAKELLIRFNILLNPLNEFSTNSNPSQMMCSIVHNNHVKKSLEPFWRKVKNNIFQHLIPSSPGWRIFLKKHSVSFEILWRTTIMQKIKKILRAVSEKYCGLTTIYGSDLIGPLPTKGRGSKIEGAQSAPPPSEVKVC